LCHSLSLPKKHKTAERTQFSRPSRPVLGCGLRPLPGLESRPVRSGRGSAGVVMATSGRGSGSEKNGLLPFILRCGKVRRMQVSAAVSGCPKGAVKDVTCPSAGSRARGRWRNGPPPRHCTSSRTGPGFPCPARPRPYRDLHPLMLPERQWFHRFQNAVLVNGLSLDRHEITPAREAESPSFYLAAPSVNRFSLGFHFEMSRRAFLRRDTLTA
jgi:hypothetical protein